MQSIGEDYKTVLDMFTFTSHFDDLVNYALCLYVVLLYLILFFVAIKRQMEAIVLQVSMAMWMPSVPVQDVGGDSLSIT